MTHYPGISMDSLMLLAQNRFEDSKPYYEEHKPAIKAQVIEPLRELVGDLSDTMLAIDPLLVVNPMVNGCVSRVRRDTRFTHDKHLYRENAWIAFLRDKKSWNCNLPAFFLDFSARHADWGLGFYGKSPKVMKALRRRIEENPQRAMDAVQAAQKAGFRWSGQPYAKPRHTEETPEILRPLYDCDTVDLVRQEKPNFVADTNLSNVLKKGFEALAPMYTLLTETVEEIDGIREK